MHTEGIHADDNVSNDDIINEDNDNIPATQDGFNTCQPIVNGLLTFVISILHNSTDPNW